MTAVEWLLEQIRLTNIEGLRLKLWDAIEQAKVMEKQEKIEFADSYGTYLLKGGIMSAGTYNETFKSE